MKTELLSPSKLSVVVNTKNSAQTLTACLKSAAMVADELLVVDMKSTDKTVDIAKKMGAKVYSFRDVGYVEPARNFALQKATGDWVMVLDADETLSPGLVEYLFALKHIPSSDTSTADVYVVPRRNMIFGKEMQATGWWPDYQVRLFKKGHVIWSEAIHSVPTTIGAVEQLPAEDVYSIQHLNYQSVEEFMDRLNRYTTIEARTDSSSNADTLISLYGDQFITRLFAQEGTKDGVRGVGLSLLQSMYPVLVSLKRWENEGRKQTISPQSVLTQATQFSKDLAYWIADWQVSRTSGPCKLYWQFRRRLRI